MKRRAAGWAFLLTSTPLLGVAGLAHAQERPAATPPPAATGAPAVPAAAESAPTAQPAPSPAGQHAQPAAPAPPTVAPVAAPAPAPAPPPAAPGRVTHGPSEALVHVAVNYRDAWLETRSYVDDGEFVRTCKAPCDLKLQVDGLEARVTAPGMTSSNTFRFAPGAGVAGVRVDGGSATLRRVGIITLASGIPIAMVGMALFAQGRLKDHDGLTAGGIGGLALGGVSIGVSLPLLLLGTTHVKSARGSLIAGLFGPAASN